MKLTVPLCCWLTYTYECINWVNQRLDLYVLICANTYQFSAVSSLYCMYDILYSIVYTLQCWCILSSTTLNLHPSKNAPVCQVACAERKIIQQIKFDKDIFLILLCHCTVDLTLTHHSKQPTRCMCWSTIWQCSMWEKREKQVVRHLYDTTTKKLNRLGLHKHLTENLVNISQ